MIGLGRGAGRVGYMGFWGAWVDGTGKADHQSTGLVKVMVKASRVGEQDQVSWGAGADDAGEQNWMAGSRAGDQEQMKLGSRMRRGWEAGRDDSGSWGDGIRGSQGSGAREVGEREKVTAGSRAGEQT